MAKTRSEIQAKYDKANTKIFTIKLNIKNDADIIKKLEIQESRQGYIKQLIRHDIKNPVPKNELLEKYTLCHDAGDYLSAPDNAENVVYLPMSEKEDNKKLVYGVFELIGTVPYK